MNTALLIIDIQNDYFEGGRMPLVKPLAASLNAYALLQCFREHHSRHVHIQHVERSSDATFFLAGDRGTDIHDSVAHFEGEPLVQKHQPNSFLATNLLELLREWKAERLIVAGMMTHMCVDATARAAVDLGFKVMVAADACATRELEYGGRRVPAEQVHAAFLAALESYGEVMNTEQILARLAREHAQENSGATNT
jgi:nicotinamidase-related amidase